MYTSLRLANLTNQRTADIQCSPSGWPPRRPSMVALHAIAVWEGCIQAAGSARRSGCAARTWQGTRHQECGSRAGRRSAQLPGAQEGACRLLSLAFASAAARPASDASPLLLVPACLPPTSVTAVRSRARSTSGSMPLLCVSVSMLAAAPPPPDCDALSWRQSSMCGGWSGRVCDVDSKPSITPTTHHGLVEAIRHLLGHLHGHPALSAHSCGSHGAAGSFVSKRTCRPLILVQCLDASAGSAPCSF